MRDFDYDKPRRAAGLKQINISVAVLIFEIFQVCDFCYCEVKTLFLDTIDKSTESTIGNNKTKARNKKQATQ